MKTWACFILINVLAGAILYAVYASAHQYMPNALWDVLLFVLLSMVGAVCNWRWVLAASQDPRDPMGLWKEGEG